MELSSDRHAAIRDDAWEALAELDRRLDTGEIDEAGWYAGIRELIVPAYRAASTPWGGSGYRGTAADWEYARSHIVDAVDRAGSFLDVGCANGHLLECLPSWTPHRLDRYGLDLAPELVELARIRLQAIADQLFVGNALTWKAPRRFTYIRTGLEYVPRYRQRELVSHLLSACDRLIIGVFREEAGTRPTEERLASWGHPIVGRSERPHRRLAGVEQRVVWIDA